MRGFAAHCALALFVTAGLLGCEGTHSSSVWPPRDAGEMPCPIGSYACPCGIHGGCEAGLVCVNDRCDEVPVDISDDDVFATVDTVAPADVPPTPDTGAEDAATAPDLPDLVTVPDQTSTSDTGEAPDLAPACDPPCSSPESICVQGSCVCAGGYHDDGAGGCVPFGACADGYAIPTGEQDCVPLAEVCQTDEICRVVTGWSDGDCLLGDAEDGSACENPEAHRCAVAGTCTGGQCEDIWPGCSEAPRPLLFVHGREGRESDLDYFASLLVADGWTAGRIYGFEARDPNDGCNVTNAIDIATEIANIHERTCAARVDVVAHGMGGLALRHYVKFLGGAEFVNVALTLGTPHGGLEDDCYNPIATCPEEEMCPTSDFLVALSQPPAAAGDVHWVSFYSDIEDPIPTASAHLNGAENVVFHGLAQGTGPDGLLGNRDVYEELKRVLSYDCW